MAVQPQTPEPVSSPVLGDRGALPSLAVAVAVAVLNEHTHQAGRCATHRSAVLADHNLTAL
jgi:hypothetical protein